MGSLGAPKCAKNGHFQPLLLKMRSQFQAFCHTVSQLNYRFPRVIAISKRNLSSVCSPNGGNGFSLWPKQCHHRFWDVVSPRRPICTVHDACIHHLQCRHRHLRRHLRCRHRQQVECAAQCATWGVPHGAEGSGWATLYLSRFGGHRDVAGVFWCVGVGVGLPLLGPTQCIGGDRLCI